MAAGGIDNKGIGVPFAQRAAHALAEIERRARADLAAAQGRPEPSSARLDACRLLERGTTIRHGELLRQYRAIDVALAAPQAAPTLVDRMLGRKPAKAVDTAALERQHAAVRSDLIQAERMMSSAIASVARAEKDQAATRATGQREAEALVRGAQMVLAEVARTRHIVTAFPRIVWCGPAFAAWTGQKVERGRRRREMRDPWATDIWGLPLEP